MFDQSNVLYFGPKYIYVFFFHSQVHNDLDGISRKICDNDIAVNVSVIKYQKHDFN